MSKRFVHSFTDDVLATSDATEVAARIKSGDYSALDATKAAINRIKQVEPSLNTLALETFDAGFLDAQRHNQGEFSGVPTVIKDNIDIAGLPTQQGATAYKAKPAKQTDPLAKQFLSQGFTLLGKTNLPEFGFNGTTEYQDGSAVNNPWHTDYSAGGSSGGSAALVAAGAVPIAHGNDGGGSIRIPASACGLVGLKSTRGRLIVSELAKKLPVNMISDGVLTRSVRDTANFMAAAENYYHNPSFKPIGHVTGANKKRLKIGVLTESITRKPIDDDTQIGIDKTVKLLSDLGHDTVQTHLPLPAEFIDGFLIYYGFMGFATHSFGKVLFGKQFNPKLLDPLTQGLRSHFLDNIKEVGRAVMLYRSANKLFKAHMQQFDLVLSPVTGVVAPKLGYLSPTVPYDELMQRLVHYAGFTAVHNVLGTPAISLPLHQTQDNRPVGMQFSAPKGDEKCLLELAFELEQASPFAHIWDY